MFKILSKQILAKGITRLEILAPEIAARARAGQFVVVRINETGERIPLTIAGQNAAAGSISVIFLEIGKTTAQLASLSPGDFILDLLGPLGRPTETGKHGAAVIVAGGVGAAEALPVAKAFRNAGNAVVGIIGARNKDMVILEKEMRSAVNRLFITTDDGSYGMKGFVSDMLKELIEKKEEIGIVYAIGPVPMMKAVSALTKQHSIKTIVSLNPLMLDATGMCGVCRVTIAGKTRFACVDGPEFDAHEVNWDELINRLATFKNEEKLSLEKYKAECKCPE